MSKKKDKRAGRDLAAALRVARARSGKKMFEVADRAGVDPSYLSRLETGGQRNPSLAVLERLAEALEVPLRDLLGEEA